MGRALAHELGHFLLGSKRHSRTGLMAAQFRPDDVTFGGAGAVLSLAGTDGTDDGTGAGGGGGGGGGGKILILGGHDTLTVAASPSPD